MDEQVPTGAGAGQEEQTEPVVTDRGQAETPRVTETTPMTSVAQAFVRAFRAALFAFLSSNAVVAAGKGDLPSHLQFLFALKVFGTSFVIAFLWNIYELSAKWDIRFPKMRA